MGKIAFVFSGQGAQYPGMGRELCEVSPAAGEVFAMADALRPGTSKQCFEGSGEELAQTVNTQPCLFCVDLAAAVALREGGIEADAVAGFSLGEIPALAFAGSWTPERAFDFVVHRAVWMQRCAEQRPGGMAAVLGLEDETVETLCEEIGDLYPVNYNCPKQLVVAGNGERMDALSERVAEAGGKTVRLAVSGAFHSPYMEEAGREITGYLADHPLFFPKIPVYANLTGEAYPEGELNRLFAQQVNHPVRWKQTVLAMERDGVDTVIEVGAGKTLRGLVRKISSSLKVYQVEDKKSLERTLQALR